MQSESGKSRQGNLQDELCVQRTFSFALGAVITLPSEFVTELSHDSKLFRGTPIIMTGYLEKGKSICHFQKPEEIKTRQVGVFIPPYLKEGDQLRIAWAETTCACATLLPRFPEKVR